MEPLAGTPEQFHALARAEARRWGPVIAATGVLHHPKYPQIPGLHSFAGQCFHSARWDHGAEIEGQRVGVIGNGSQGRS